MGLWLVELWDRFEFKCALELNITYSFHICYYRQLVGLKMAESLIWGRFEGKTGFSWVFRLKENGLNERPIQKSTPILSERPFWLKGQDWIHSQIRTKKDIYRKTTLVYPCARVSSSTVVSPKIAKKRRKCFYLRVKLALFEVKEVFWHFHPRVIAPECMMGFSSQLFRISNSLILTSFYFIIKTCAVGVTNWKFYNRTDDLFLFTYDCKKR